MPFPAELPTPLIEKAVLAALEEDLGLAGDLTTQATIAPGATSAGVIASREDGIVAGLTVAETAFRLAGPGIAFKACVSDGGTISKGGKIAEVSGNARTLLAGERVALNFLSHMSGIATLTRKFADAVKGTNARVCDTRKTLPGLRVFEKYAVRCGGGSNHRFGLGDAILIKDNHIAVAGSVGQAVKAARDFAGHMVVIEVEVDNLDQMAEALEAGAAAILLDNMDNATLRRAVELNRGRARLEASGGVTLERARGIAETGVDFISASRITMAAPPLDLGLDIEIG